jgi:hypothetical protein
MDDQGIHREGGRSQTTTPPRRIQFGVRLMLLWVALFCVLAATLATDLTLRREAMIFEIYELQAPFRYGTDIDPAKQKEIDARIQQLKRATGQ